MNEEENLKNDTIIMLELLRKEKLIKGAKSEYEKENKQQQVSLLNSKAQIEGDFVVVHLKDEQYENIATYRVFNDNNYRRVDK